MRKTLLFILVMAIGGCTTTSQNLHLPESLPDATPRLAPLEANEWSDSARHALQPLLKNNDTFNVFKVIANNPELLDAWNPLGLYLLRSSSLPARDREILILKTAALAGSAYEFSQHALIAEQAGLNALEIQTIASNKNPDAWSAIELSLLAAATELNTSNTISDHTWAMLSEHYDDKQLLDIIATVGQYRSLAMLLNALRVPIDAEIPRITLPPQAE